MKKTLFLLAVLAVVIYASSCRKCYHCYNECVLCTYPYLVYDSTVLTDTVSHTSITLYDTVLKIDSTVHCKEAYNSAEDFYRAIGKDTLDTLRITTCRPTTSTYKYDFCVGKSGEERYPHYFDLGGRAVCDPK